MAETIPHAQERSRALAGIAEQLAGAAPDPALIERALTVAGTIPDDLEPQPGAGRIAEWLAGAAPADPALIERALAVARPSPTTSIAARRWPASPSGWPVLPPPTRR